MRQLLLAPLLFCTIIISFTACNKNSSATDPNTALSDDIKNFVPDSVIQKAEAAGMIINKGKTPTDINGIYLAAPNITVYDNSNLYQPGKKISDQKFKFYDQNTNALTVKYNSYAVTADQKGEGRGAFLAGDGNKFTVFVDLNGIIGQIHYKSIVIISGEKTPEGIKNFRYCTNIQSKDPDPEHKVAAVGTFRLFKDDLAENQIDF